MSGNNLFHLFVNAISIFIENHGYSKMKRHPFFYKSFQDDIIGFITFTKASCGKSNATYVNIGMGIAKQDVERIILKLQGIETDCYPICNSFFNISDVYSEYSYSDFEWLIKDQNSINYACEKAQHVITELINPYYSNHCNLDSYRQLIINNIIAGRDYKDKVVPVLHYIEGNEDLGLDYINRRIKESKNAYQGELDRRFIEGFRTIASK